MRGLQVVGGQQVARRRRRLTAVAAVFGLGLATAGCGMQYYGYNGGDPRAALPDGYTRGQRAAQDGANASRIGVYQCEGTAPAISQFTALKNPGLGLPGMQPLLMIKWCRTSDNTHDQVPPSDQEWSNWVRDVTEAAIDAGNVPAAVELWNEPNNPGQLPPLPNPYDGNPTWYAQHIFVPGWQGVQAALAARPGTPNIPVITAGMAPLHSGNFNLGMTCGPQSDGYECPATYLTNVLSALQPYSISPQGIGAHLYADVDHTDSAYIENQMKTEFNSMDSTGGHRPVWVTEMGRATNNQVLPTQQGDILKTVFDWLRNNTNDDAKAALGWDLTDADNVGNRNYGVLDTLGSPKGGSTGAYCRVAAEANLTPQGC